ncbi:hypothetical protein CEXT_105381 [Caerostris extrusa]|uniref:Uncharacterized protein n=1 Tax=Caerostris extrusa TaxID=172846 RepID=A0AAV4NM05_CAEEX|nr:hypothetical protein CEXT_105381 [Caerostris extrusa]
MYYSRKRYLMATESLWGFRHKDKLESAELVFKRAKKSPIDNNKVVDAPKINPPNEKSYQEAIEEDIFAQYSSTS